MRNIKELLEMSLEMFPKLREEQPGCGICFIIITAYYGTNSITIDEAIDLHNYFKANLPNKKYDKNRFCWPRKDTESRINWLKEQIEKVS